MKCKFISGYEGLYMAYEDGRILGCKRGKFLSTSNKAGWYIKVNLRKNNQSNCIYVHRIIADVFLNNENNYNEVNHIDGDKTNNNVSNLEWCTHSHNIQHAFDTGLKDRSLITGMKPKLSREQESHIANEYKLTSITYAELGKKYNVSRETIRRTVIKVSA